MKLTDDSRMPFGKHRDAKMEDVPAEYLLWLRDDMQPLEPDASEERRAVLAYILDNEDVLESEL